MIILLVIQFTFALLLENYYHSNEFSFLITWDSNMEGHINKRKKAFDVRQQKILRSTSFDPELLNALFERTTIGLCTGQFLFFEPV